MLIPSRRLLTLALLGVAPIAVSGSTGLALFIALVWAGAIVITFAADGFMAPGKNGLEWSRSHESKLYLGIWNSVTLCCRSQTGATAEIRTRDVVPALIIPRGNESSFQLLPRFEHDIEYSVLPLHRGTYNLGPVVARVRGPLGLAWRQSTWKVETRAQVYPNLAPIRSYEALARRGQLEEMGVRNARRFGRGTEFDRLRDYTPDDEFRRINWNATARLNRLIATDYRTDRSQNVVLALDAGRLMSTPVRLEGIDEPSRPGLPPALTRFDHAVNAALLVCFVAQQTGDRVGLICFGNGIVRYLPPRPGRRAFLAMTHALHDVQPTRVEPDYGLAMRYLGARQSQRSLVILFTDMVEPMSAQPLVQGVRHLARRHLCLVVGMRDPDIDRAAHAMVSDSTSSYERAVAQATLDDREAVLASLTSGGVATIDLPASSISIPTVNRYLEIKGRMLL